DLKDKHLILKMQGACVGCPSASETLKYGITSVIKYYIPEIELVSTSTNDELEKVQQEALENLETGLKNNQNDNKNT
ncbi:MAG: nifu-like protein, partial [Paramarteilia canceri]